MNAADLSTSTIAQLLEKFRVLALAKNDASQTGQVTRYNRLYRRLDDVQKELRSREGDQRRALVVFYDHPNPQVRLDAAMATLVVFPDKARAALQMIIDRDEFPQAGNAGFTLLYLKDGRFVPE